ncbi:unnamed protein product [Durusdinium trenchii]|uniref:Uncharacterized protein n=1 Tax=Durusdinium trenchii TaxID=1381693 RepID=A0ABP0HDD9_9DINO
MSRFGMEEYTTFFLKFLVALFFLMTFGQVGQLAYCWLMTGGLSYWVMTSGLGFTSDDAIATIATVFGLRAIPFLYKRLITLAATYPLALTFRHIHAKRDETLICFEDSAQVHDRGGSVSRMSHFTDSRLAQSKHVQT